MNIGQLDQILTAIKDIVSVQVKYYEECKNQGMDEGGALLSSIEFIKSMMNPDVKS